MEENAEEIAFQLEFTDAKDHVRSFRVVEEAPALFAGMTYPIESWWNHRG